MAKHERNTRWKRFKTRLLDPEYKEDRRSHRRSMRDYYKSDEYKENSIGFGDIWEALTGVFRRNRYGRH